MRARHVLGHGGVPAAGAAQQMAGDALSPVEQLDGALGDARLELLAQHAMRHRVVMAIDVDVVVEADPALTPLGVDVGSTGKAASAGRSSSSNSWRRLTPSRRIGRLLSSLSNPAMARFSSLRVKKR